MSVVSGKDAYVDGVPCTTSWSATVQASLNQYACSATQGGTGVVEGNLNWAGQMSGLGPNPPVQPGTEYPFKGAIEATAGDGLALEGTVLIGAVSITFPVQSGAPITWTASFLVQGILVETTTVYVDPTSKLATSAKDAGITIDPSGTPFVVPDVQSISLSFDAPANSFVRAGEMHRKAGNLSASLTFALLNRSLYVPQYQPNVRDVVHVTLDDGTFWELDEVVFGGLTNFSVNTATSEIVGYSVNGMWSAVSSLTTDALGKLTSPNGTAWFPAA